MSLQNWYTSLNSLDSFVFVLLQKLIFIKAAVIMHGSQTQATLPKKDLKRTFQAYTRTYLCYMQDVFVTLSK